MRAEDYEQLYRLEESLWWFVGMCEVTSSLLDPFCPSDRDRLILDAGCGTGGMLSRLARYAGSRQVIGMDFAPAALEFCRSRRHPSLAQASVTDLPFADAAFDLVTSFDVLVQLPGEQADERAMREMYRVLRPGGLAFVRVAAYEWMRSDHDEALGTQRRYRLGALVEKMEGAGFEVLRATYANALLLPVAMLRRLVLKRLGLAARGSDVRPLPASLGWLNQALAGALRLEARYLADPRAKLHAGLSAICLAQRPVGLPASSGEEG
jgi:SAM-dependent methyltransferase